METKIEYEISTDLDVNLTRNYTLFVHELERIAFGRENPNFNHGMTSAEYERFVSDMWIGIILTLLMILIVFALCVWYMYHKFQQWKRHSKSDNNLKKTVFSNIKDPTPTMLQSGLVYEVTCSCGTKYVGQTIQLLKERLSQHNCRTKKEGLSAFTEHIIESNHDPLWQDTKILYKETNKKKRDILEMIAIKRQNNCINKQTDSIMLSTTYNNIIMNSNRHRQNLI